MKKFYLRFVLTLITILMFSASGFAQNTKTLWSKTTQNKLSKKEQVFRKTQPKKADFYQLNLSELQGILNNAPDRKTTQNSNLIISFPTSDGTFESFRIMEASVMAPELQNKYPDLRSYAGQSIENPSTLIRFSITTQGLHAMLLSPEKGTQFIDPYTKGSNDYIVYSKRDLPALDQAFECGVIDGGIDVNEKTIGNDYQLRNADDGMMRDYRLAIATTIEYSAFHWMAAGLTAGDTEAAKKTAVMAAIVVTMTRNNFVYERDLSITMTLVANNDSIVFIDSDNFSNNSAGALIGESQTVIDNIIGNPNYDVGHTFSTGGGGLATLNSPCNNNTKARGITGGASPVGDPYDIDFVAHELGHQFGAPHTWNGTEGNCTTGARSPSNAYEVGSGTTIMAYAGICASDNIQSNSDAYFHQKSLQMIWDNISTGIGSTCPNETATGNSAPTSNAGADYTIPASTPYKITGSSTDADGIGTHTYTWEQYDLGPAGLPLETNTTGPLVRSYEGTGIPTRYVPRLEDFPVGSGGVSTTWEKLASVDRAIRYRLTVRDNDTSGGQTAVDEMMATVNSVAGPFLVTSQNTNEIVWTPGMMETITWDVAGTTANGIDTANVNILLSTDQGLTYNTVLATNVPNDGSHDITVPDIDAPFCRIMVEGAGNIFFNVNDYFFAIGNYTYEVIPETCQNYNFPINVAVPESDSQFTGFSLDVPDSVTMSDLNVSVDITHDNGGDIFIGVRPPFETTGENRMISGACVGPQDIIFTFDDEGAAVNCASTNTNDNVLPVETLSFADGQDSAGTWVFFITDITVGGSQATLNDVTLTICTGGTTTPVLGINEFDIENSLSVYPNPNNGEFNVKFNTTSNNIDIQVYDIRGRSVLNSTFENTSGAFNKAVNLGNVESGMYLLNINDGSKTVTKKIIVE